MIALGVLSILAGIGIIFGIALEYDDRRVAYPLIVFAAVLMAVVGPLLIMEA